MPDHAHDVARQRLVEELGQLDLLNLWAGGVFDEDSGTAGGVQRVDLTGRVLSGCRDSCVSEKVTVAHQGDRINNGLGGGVVRR